jgi:hypothetical protein
MADEYERANVAADAEVTHRDKVVSRGTALACAFMGLLFAGLTVAAVADRVWGAVAVFPLLALGAVFLGLTRPVIRTALTRDELRVHWGLQALVIPLRALRSARVREAGRAQWAEAVGEPGAAPLETFVLTSGPRAADVPLAAGSVGFVVELVWDDAAAGKTRRAWLSAAAPDALVAAIEAARPREATGVRVDDARATGDGAPAEAAAEHRQHEAQRAPGQGGPATRSAR